MIFHIIAVTIFTVHKGFIIFGVTWKHLRLRSGRAVE